MSRQRFDAAIVDLDGTMLDTLGDFVIALGRTLTELGLRPVERGFIERTVGKGSDTCCEAAWPKSAATLRWSLEACRALQVSLRLDEVDLETVSQPLP